LSCTMACRRYVYAIGIAGFACQTDGKAAQLIQSAGPTGDRLTVKGNIQFVPDFEFSGPVVSVSRTLDQKIEGFGGAFTEASALVFKGMPPEKQQQILEMYFGPSGIGYTLGRIHINSCDFSPGHYSFDDVADDFELKHFDTEVTHDQEALIPLVQKAQQVLASHGRGLKLLAVPWSPPAWMKTSGKMDGSDHPGLKEECRWTWAQYFSKWITAYKAHGIPIWAVTPQNEPRNVAIWEACVYAPEQEMSFVAEHLGPALRADHPEVKLLIYDHNKNHVYEWSQALYSNPYAAPFADGVAFHWYSGDQFNEVQKIHQEHPDAILLASEATYERWRWAPGTNLADGDWNFGMGYAHDILNDLNVGAGGWIDWNLILDEHGGPNHVDNVCDAAMIGNGNDLFIHPQYYAIGHFSKYILPESRRLESIVTGSTTYQGPTRDYGSCDGQDGLEATSFLRPDALVVVVVLNCGPNPIEFKLQDGSVALKATIPAQGLQTYLLDRDASALFAV